ncbi:tRNA (guanosine(37)-N1)-methyltransferase TrmD [Patescibacteria group bacterium]|nr:MAG: tRNA (guanosine(37)-N1)-methyltransferase TrmD [Patescibacteria group bacterium]
MTFHVVTLFPDALTSYLEASIIGRAIKDKWIKVKFYNPRDFTKNKWHRVDQRPYGGGPGMVLEAEPFLKAVKKALGRKKGVVYFFDASGKQFTNTDARALARNVGPTRSNIVLICGHYEGIDARVQKILKAKPISIGSYTLTGGELPAMVVIDAVSRQIPGVLGSFESIEEERVASSEVYTRPEVLKWAGKNHSVPKVLLSGNHAKIEEWKRGGKEG